MIKLLYRLCLNINIYLSLIALIPTLLGLLILSAHIVQLTQALAIKQSLFFKLSLHVFLYTSLTSTTLYVWDSTNYYLSDLLILLDVTDQTLLSISLLLHAVFAYVFAFSTVYSVIVSSFLYMYIKLAFYCLASWLKTKLLSILK